MSRPNSSPDPSRATKARSLQFESFQNEYPEICAVQYTIVHCEFEPVLYCIQEFASHTVHTGLIVCLIWLLRACR
jgi:hypothetical protein